MDIGYELCKHDIIGIRGVFGGLILWIAGGICHAWLDGRPLFEYAPGFLGLHDPRGAICLQEAVDALTALFCVMCTMCFLVLSSFMQSAFRTFRSVAISKQVSVEDLDTSKVACNVRGVIVVIFGFVM